MRVLTPDEAAQSLTDAQQDMLSDLVARTDGETSRSYKPGNNFVEVRVDDIYYRHMGAIGESDGDAPAVAKVMDVYEDSYRQHGWRVKTSDDRTEYEFSPEEYHKRIEARRQARIQKNCEPDYRWLWWLLFPIAIPVSICASILHVWRMPQVTRMERDNRAGLLLSLAAMVLAVIICAAVFLPMAK